MRARILCPPAAAVGLLSLLSLARCSLVTSLDGLTGGERDAASSAVSTGSDAGSAAEGNGASDAGNLPDVTTSAAPPPDSGSGAGVDGGTVLQPVATDSGTDAGTVVFEDDFEGAQALPRAWDVMTTTGGTLALDPSLFLSPTTSLNATTVALDAGAPGDAVNVTLRKLFAMPPAGTTVAYAFAAYAKQYDPAANIVLGALQISDGAGDLYELQLDVQKNAGGSLNVIFAEYTGLVDGGSAYVAHPVPGTLAVETWTPIRVELDLVQPPIARVYFAGSLALETSVTITIPGSAVQISLGISYASAPTEAWIVNYDDVVYSLR